MFELLDLQYHLEGLLEMSQGMTSSTESRQWVAGYRYGLQQALTTVNERIDEYDAMVESREMNLGEYLEANSIHGFPVNGERQS